VRFAARCGAVIATAALAACAQVARVDHEAIATADAPFVATGRLSARHGSDALSANFNWQHRPAADSIALATPLGQTLATLARDDGTVSIVLADGRSASADTFDALTAKTFGVPLPVAGLTWWIRGRPREGSAFAIERDAAGRANVLRQDGWEIVYTYADDASVLPRRLTLAYPDVDIRVVVDQWQ
jgi:outer membrane lipoprotein LolB